MASEQTEHGRGSTHATRESVELFMQSPNGRYAIYRWAVQDAERMNRIEKRLRRLEGPWWRRWRRHV